MTAFGILLIFAGMIWLWILILEAPGWIDTQKRRRRQLIACCESMYGLGHNDHRQDKPLKKMYVDSLSLMTGKEKAIASCLDKVYEQGYRDALNNLPRRPETLITKELRGVIKWKIITIHDVLVFM